jgi:high affinity Mn2+ porin
VAELNQKAWALRLGYFLVPRVSNANTFDLDVGRRGSYVAELELRHTIAAQPGKVRFLAWLNETFSGSYRDALLDPNIDPAPSRRTRSKYGVGVNVEQAITDELGFFSRLSWNNGQNEIMSFTDIDASVSGGFVLKGKAWGRPEDSIGLGGAVNGLSAAHRAYLAAGGIGILVGDGALNYRTERILETYYTYVLNKHWTLTADYQFIVNPAYNADRGPVSIFGARVHGEF